MNKFMVRHGDVLIESIASIPEGAKVRQSNIILTGVNGHHHVLTNGTILDSDGVAYVQVEQGNAATLIHDEHNTIELAAGSYVVIRQREFDPYDQVIRNVED